MARISENGELPEGVKRRLVKILALAERGEAGEKSTAEAMLVKLMRKHGLTLADLTDDTDARDWVEINVETKFELNLLLQVIRKVTGVTGDLSYKSLKRGKKKRCWYEMTKAEHMEIVLMLDLYRAALFEEFDLVTTAFIHKNSIFGPTVEKDDSDDDTPTAPLDRARLGRIAHMMSMMSKVDIHRALPHNRENDV